MQSRSIRRSLTAAIAACLAFLATAGHADPPAAEPAIRRLLAEQAAAWNRGDLDGFMAGYWRSPDLVFTSGGVVRRGWQVAYDHYRSRYGGAPETMGRLELSAVEVHPLGTDAAWVLGHWTLSGAQADDGVFTLVLRRIDGTWRIVHDHTSSRVSPVATAAHDGGRR